MTYKAYAGIGSRETPADIMEIMSGFAVMAESLGWTLRSGAASGADSAFEAGVTDPKMKEIYLPWARFNNHMSKLCPPSELAFTAASLVHPVWNTLTDTAKKFHARNSHQMLGIDMDNPVKFVICWTENGKYIGGTSQATRMADMLGVPVFNLGGEVDEEALEKILTGS